MYSFRAFPYYVSCIDVCVLPFSYSIFHMLSQCTISQSQDWLFCKFVLFHIYSYLYLA